MQGRVTEVTLLFSINNSTMLSIVKSNLPCFIFAFSIIFGCSSEKKKEGEASKIPDIPIASDFVKVGTGPSGMEGPAVSKDGILYFVNADKNGNIGRVDLATQKFDILIDSLPAGSYGNGIRFNKAGKMLVADYTNHNVLEIDPVSVGVSIYAHEDQMNQPNDIAIGSTGVLFASDPNWSEETGQLWRIDTEGTVTLLESGMGTTNGIEVSPDEKTLYVNESVQRNVWAYDLSPQGGISNKRLLIKFEDFGMDGMRCDEKGNLYITRHGKGTIAVVSPTGELVMEVKLKGEKPSNIAFGGKDGKTCYITLQDRGFIEIFIAPFRGRSLALL